jgi:hypothetical protein
MGTDRQYARRSRRQVGEGVHLRHPVLTVSAIRQPYQKQKGDPAPGRTAPSFSFV